MRRICDAYGWADVGLIIHEIGDRFPCARDDLARAGRAKGAASFENKAGWMDGNAAALIQPSPRRGS